jgi:hypothetical protein
MNVSASIPVTVEIGRNRLLGLLVAVAAVAATITYVVVVLAFDDGHSTAAPSVLTGASAPVSSAAQDARRVPSVMSLTPARLAAGALGTGYALPSTRNDPTLASVLASMSPETRRYTKRIMSLTFAQLAAGAAGSP